MVEISVHPLKHSTAMKKRQKNLLSPDLKSLNSKKENCCTTTDKRIKADKMSQSSSDNRSLYLTMSVLPFIFGLTFSDTIHLCILKGLCV